MTGLGTYQRMREESHENAIVRVVNPTVRDAVEILQSVLGVSPKATLKGIGCCVSVPHFADVFVCRAVEPVNGVPSPSFPFFPPDAMGLAHSTIIVEDEDVAPVILFVVYQREDVDVSELRKSRIAQYPLNVGLTGDVSFLLLQPGKHPKRFVRGELKGAVPVSLEADGEFRFRNLVDDLDVFFLRLGSIAILTDVK